MEGIIKNPTDELIEPMHGGKTFSFPPGKIMQIPVKSANHIMNEYGRRGLISLNYGDNGAPSKNNPDITIEQEKSEIGRRNNKKYKTAQVENYNQDNESRANNNTPYVKPPEQVEAYAKELGLQLIAPYRAPDQNQVAMNNLTEENLTLKENLALVLDQNAQILKRLDGQEANTNLKTTEELDEAELIAGFMRMNTNQLSAYVDREKAVIAVWPEHVKTKLRERWTKLTGKSLAI